MLTAALHPDDVTFGHIAISIILLMICATLFHICLIYPTHPTAQVSAHIHYCTGSAKHTATAGCGTSTAVISYKCRTRRITAQINGRKEVQTTCRNLLRG